MSTYADKIVPAFVAASSVFGGIAPRHLEHYLLPAIAAHRDGCGFVADMEALALAVRAAVEAANRAAVEAEFGAVAAQTSPMIMLEIDDRPDPEAGGEPRVNITYGGGRTFARLIVHLATGHCSWDVGARPYAVRWSTHPEGNLPDPADLEASALKRLEAGRAAEDAASV